MKLSPWWDAVTQPPVHLGWYQVDWPDRPDNGVADYWLWDGEDWYMQDGNDLLWAGDSEPGDKWRGVLREDEA